MQLYEATKGFILLFEFDVLEHRLEDGDFSDGAVSVKSVHLPRSKDSTAPEVKAEWEGLLEVERQEGAIRLFCYCLDHILQIPFPSGTKTRPLLTSVRSPLNLAAWMLMLVWSVGSLQDLFWANSRLDRMLSWRMEGLCEQLTLSLPLNLPLLILSLRYLIPFTWLLLRQQRSY